MLAESNVRRGFLETYEVDLLVRALPEYLQGMVRFAYLTGWRLSEITGLRWEDVDLYNEAILVETSKNAQGRVLALRGELRTILQHQAQDATEWVFQLERRPVGDFRKAWRTACKAAGIPGKRFHDLRRSGVRNLVRAGVDASVVMSISGHKTRSVFDRYNVTSMDDIRGAVDQLGKYLDTVRVSGKNYGERTPESLVPRGSRQRKGT